MRIISKRLAPAWLMCIPFTYFVMGLLSNFYATSVELTLSSLAIQLGELLFLHPVLPIVWKRIQSKPVDMGIAFALFTTLFSSAWSMFNMAGQFPALFDAGFYRLETNQLIYFGIAIALSLPLTM